MEKDEFVKLKLRFIAADLQEKIRLYTQTEGLTGPQYKELLQQYPYGKLDQLEAAFG